MSLPRVATSSRNPVATRVDTPRRITTTSVTRDSLSLLFPLSTLFILFLCSLLFPLSLPSRPHPVFLRTRMSFLFLSLPSDDTVPTPLCVSCRQGRTTARLCYTLAHAAATPCRSHRRCLLLCSNTALCVVSSSHTLCHSLSHTPSLSRIHAKSSVLLQSPRKVS